MVRIPDTGNEGSIPSGNIHLGKFTSNGTFSNLPVAGYVTASYEVAYEKSDTFTVYDTGTTDLGERNSVRYIKASDDLIVPTGQISIPNIEIPDIYNSENHVDLPSTKGMLIHRYKYDVPNIRDLYVYNEGSFGFYGSNATAPKVYLGPVRANNYNINAKLATSSYTIVKPGHYLLIFLKHLTREDDAWSTSSQFGPYKWDVRFSDGSKCYVKVNRINGGIEEFEGFEKYNSWNFDQYDVLNNLGKNEKIDFCFTRKEETGLEGGIEICLLNGHFRVGDIVTMEMCDNCYSSSSDSGLIPGSDSLVLTNCSRAMGMIYLGPSLKTNLLLTPVTKSSLTEDQIYSELNTAASYVEFEAPVDGNYLFLLVGRGNGINLSPTSIFQHGIEGDSSNDGVAINDARVNIHDILPAQQVIATSNWSVGLRFWRCTLIRGQVIEFQIPATTSAKTTLREIIPTIMHTYKTNVSYMSIDV